ncbi:MAG TPA: hypothetical protein VKJ45_00870, partial [Blastocatellia bacterium]|nr:hypothetical protein [Blastocatellia bacterium]
MKKLIAIPLMAAIFLIYTVGLITRTAADGFGPDPGFVVNFPPGQVDPFQYGPRPFPDKLPTRVRVGSGAAPDESAARLLEPGIFNSLSSAGQRGALMLNGRAPESVRRQVNPSPQDAPDPPLDPGENVRVTSAGDDSRGPGHHTHSETSICADGNNVIVSFNTDGVSSNAFSGFAVSSDAGRTFRSSTVPNLDPVATLGDGVVALGTRNLIYYATL